MAIVDRAREPGEQSPPFAELGRDYGCSGFHALVEVLRHGWFGREQLVQL